MVLSERARGTNWSYRCLYVVLFPDTELPRSCYHWTDPRNMAELHVERSQYPTTAIV